MSRCGCKEYLAAGIMSFSVDADSLLEAMGITLNSSSASASRADESSTGSSEATTNSSSHFDVLSDDCLDLQSIASLQTNNSEPSPSISDESGYFINDSSPLNNMRRRNPYEDDPQTILSSNPSSVNENDSSLFSSISTQPTMQIEGERERMISSTPFDDIQSLSTVSSQSTFLVARNEEDRSQMKTVTDDDLQSVSLVSIGNRPSSNELDYSATRDPEDNHDISHHPESFVNVANRLMREESSSSLGGTLHSWYKYFTERDWQMIQTLGEAVMGASSTSRGQQQQIPQLVLPSPTLVASEPLQAFTSASSVAEQQHGITTAHLSGILPKSCICKFCHDTVVGAYTLECGCSQAVVCSSCWAQYVETTFEGSSTTSDDGDSSLTTTTQCPGCATSVSGGSPCHALDVAILQIMMSARVQQSLELSSLRDSYFERLNAWNETVLDRQEEDARRKDAYLARLLEEEEAFFYNNFRTESSGVCAAKQNVLLETAGQVLVGVLVGALAASFGFGHIRGKNRVL